MRREEREMALADELNARNELLYPDLDGLGTSADGHRVIRGTRPIYLADLDRQHMASRLAWVTIAPITSQIRGIPTEVKVDAGPETGLKLDSVISGDNIRTVKHSCGRIEDQRP